MPAPDLDRMVDVIARQQAEAADVAMFSLGELAELLIYAEQHGLPVYVEDGAAYTVRVECCPAPTRNCLLSADLDDLFELCGVEDAWRERTSQRPAAPRFADDATATLVWPPVLLSSEGTD